MVDPRKWNAICWLMLLLWCLASIPSNIPFDADIPEPGPINLPDGSTAYAYEHIHLIGFPLSYLEIQKSPNKPSTTAYNPLKLFFNVILIGATFAGIVYSIQTLIPKFSIRTLLLFVTLIASLFPLGNMIFATDSYHLQTGFIMAIYFAPLIATIPAFVYSRHQKLSQKSTAE